MPDKYDDEIQPLKLPGRPPRDPRKKVGLSVRCLVTGGVSNLIDDACQMHGINRSDYLRLAIYAQLKKDGFTETEDYSLTTDTTFEVLRESGML